jgi:hypothetical protein
MSKALETFNESIKDAEELLTHFDHIRGGNNQTKPDEKTEVLKRSGLIMAVAAWETYVEDRLREIVESHLVGLHNSVVAKIIKDKLEEDLKRFNTPNTDNVKRVFLTYSGNDITTSWAWNNVMSKEAQQKLNQFIVKRGEAAHRSKTRGDSTAPHLITKDELRSAIHFFKELAKATDKT